jgi:hypothetical protein
VGGAGRLDYPPAVDVEDAALLRRQRTIRVAQDQSGPQRQEGAIDVRGVGVSREVQGMYAQICGSIRPAPVQPQPLLRPGAHPVLHHLVDADHQRPHVHGPVAGFDQLQRR